MRRSTAARIGSALERNLPPVPVYDLVFQEKANALVLGTHGRGIWVLDHIEPLAQMTPDVLSGGGHLFPVPPVHHQVIYPGQFWFGAGEFFAPNPPFGAVLTYYLPKITGGAVQISISDAAGRTLRTLRGPALAGLNRTCWDLRQAPAIPEQGTVPMGNCGGVTQSLFGVGRGGPVVMPGKYTVVVTPMGGAPGMKTEITVLPDPRWNFSDADRKTRYAAIMSAYSLQQQLVPARDTAQRIAEQVSAIRQYLAAAGEGGRQSLPAVEKVSVQIGQVQGQVNRPLASAAGVQSAIDGYDGLPTAAQLKQLDWAWEDATAGVAALNRLIERDLPAVYTAVGGAVRWPEVKPVGVPAKEGR